MKKIIPIAVVLLSLLAVSCEKEESTTTSPSLYGLQMGSYKLFVPLYEEITFTLNPSNLYTSDGSTPGVIGLSCQVNSEKRDTVTKNYKTDPTYIYRYTPMAKGLYDVYAYAYSEGYYSSSYSIEFRGVDPDDAIEGLEGDRIGLYREKLIAGKTWMAENLYGTATGLSYMGCPVMNSVVGQFYTYEEALTACPSGWHLPTEAEWNTLGTDAGALMVNAKLFDTRIWTYSKEVTLSNSLGFNAIGTGYIDIAATTEETITGDNSFAAFWTADSIDADYARYIYLGYSTPDVKKGKGSKATLALSVRCVKD